MVLPQVYSAIILLTRLFPRGQFSQRYQKLCPMGQNLRRKANFWVAKFACCFYGNSFRCALFRLADIKVGENTYISRKSRIHPGVSIGSGVKVESEVIIRAGAYLGSDVEVRRGATIGRDVKIANNVTIGERALIANAFIGEGSFIEYGVLCNGMGDKQIIIGCDCYVGIHAVLNWCGGIQIGDCVHIAGPSVGLWTHSSVMDSLLGHKLNDHSDRKVAAIKIESNAWIGGNSTIYPGVTIEHHSVILPNSAVNRNVAAMTAVGGVPAQVIESTSAMIRNALKATAI